MKKKKKARMFQRSYWDTTEGQKTVRRLKKKLGVESNSAVIRAGVSLLAVTHGV